MAFFKDYNGTTNSRLLWVERLVWILVYGGLLSIIVAQFTADADPSSAHVMRILGAIAVIAGIFLIYLRSRLREEDQPATGDKP